MKIIGIWGEAETPTGFRYERNEKIDYRELYKHFTLHNYDFPFSRFDKFKITTAFHDSFEDLESFDSLSGDEEENKEENEKEEEE